MAYNVSRYDRKSSRTGAYIAFITTFFAIVSPTAILLNKVIELIVILYITSNSLGSFAMLLTITSTEGSF